MRERIPEPPEGWKAWADNIKESTGIDVELELQKILQEEIEKAFEEERKNNSEKISLKSHIVDFIKNS